MAMFMAFTPPSGRGRPWQPAPDEPTLATRIRPLSMAMCPYTAVARSRPRARRESMPDALHHLFAPLRVGSLALANRIFSSGHAEAMAEDGRVGRRLIAYHEAKARGGAALTIIGGSTSVHPSSPSHAWNMIANHDDSVIPGYRGMAEAAHRHGCRVMSQLTHMGRRSQSDVESWHVLL